MPSRRLFVVIHGLATIGIEKRMNEFILAWSLAGKMFARYYVNEGDVEIRIKRERKKTKAREMVERKRKEKDKTKQIYR